MPPIREYEFSCKHSWEVLEAMSEKASECPKCGELNIVQVISRTAPPILKGVGFYSNDYNGKKPK